MRVKYDFSKTDTNHPHFTNEKLRQVSNLSKMSWLIQSRMEIWPQAVWLSITRVPYNLSKHPRSSVPACHSHLHTFRIVFITSHAHHKHTPTHAHAHLGCLLSYFSTSTNSSPFFIVMMFKIFNIVFIVYSEHIFTIGKCISSIKIINDSLAGYRIFESQFFSQVL